MPERKRKWSNKSVSKKEVSKKEVLHTEEIKQKYSNLERNIKRRLIEWLLHVNIWDEWYISRGLSFTKDFEIRELEEYENPKFHFNLANIKEWTSKTLINSLKNSLFDEIDRNIEEEDIKKAYKNGIRKFIEMHMKKNIQYLVDKKNLTYRKFITQYHHLIKKWKDGIEKYNAYAQIGKLMNEKFWERAFSVQKDADGKEEIVFSELCRKYMFTLFYNANTVWKEWWKSISQVFHDGDFPFITDKTPADLEDYVEVVQYLITRDKHNPFWKRSEEWNKEWSKKTAQYADILWALTNNQLGIHKLVDNETYNPWLSEDFEDEPDFEWDYTTTNLEKIWGWQLTNIVESYNMHEKKWENPFRVWRRKKSLSSCVEKIIEWKKINDAIGFRISMEDASKDHFTDIEKIASEWIKYFVTSLENHPDKYVNAKDWEKIEIRSITIDNKNVLKIWEMNQILEDLNGILPGKVAKREKQKSSFITEEEWKNEMKEHHVDDFKDTEKWLTYLAFYRQITGGKPRGVNGAYKDFKFNVIIDVKDREGNSVWEKTIEVQFDDINNGVGLANYNIRNCERSINTQSNLSFNLPLSSVRKEVEKNIKKMAVWAKHKDRKFSIIDFFNGVKMNISWFNHRNISNSTDIDKTIIEVINYFIKKGSFFFYYKSKDWKTHPREDIMLSKWLLTTNNLDSDDLYNIQVVSSQEIWKQQYSYLRDEAEAWIWIYDGDQEKVLWAKLWDIVNRVNLWKRKDPQYYVVWEKVEG